MACNGQCRCGNKICPKAVYSTAVTVITVAGVDNLVIDIPASTYFDGCKYCLFVTQAIPATATINMPVSISIGGNTATVYPLVRCDCAQVTACAIRTRSKYPARVSTTGTGGVFKVLYGLSCAPNNALASLPVVTPTAPATPAVAPANAAITQEEASALTNAKSLTKTVTTKTSVKAE